MLWWMLATLCAFFVKGLCGFANTLVFTTILSFGSSNLSITPVELLLGFPTNLILAWKERKSNPWKIFLLKNADSRGVKILFGLVIVGIGVELLLREYRPRQGKESRAALLAIGILSGILSGMYGIGAMLAAYVGRVTKDSHSFKANMCAVFIAENLFRLPMYTMTGILTLASLRQAALLFPVMLAGLFAGIGSGNLLDERVVRRVVIVMLIVSGMALVGAVW